MATDRRQHHAGRLLAVSLALASSACTAPQAPASDGDGPLNMGISLLTASERRVRAGQIRDAALASGMTEGYLLAGIADAETNMSHCWSELTWACQGPPSADCGGGPVVAGAGDGPCENLQGGLGMFQFDAGTHSQTLAREGDRILSIAGNTQAAVDFVVAMLIRSVYVDGVDDRAQAIAWSNGVRRDNERWDPWIRTVTHYYNGCTPSASCWSSRYARYRDITSAVYDEMGAEFWQHGIDFAAQYVNQSFPLAAQPFELAPGQEVAGHIELRNAGTATWTPGATFLGTTEPRDAMSPLAAADWVAPHRPATVDRAVAPSETGRFAFTVRAPREPGDYPQFFSLVQENVAWFSDRGGPPDNQLQVRVTVMPGEPPAADAGTTEDSGVTAPPGADAGDPIGQDAAGRGSMDDDDADARSDEVDAGADGGGDAGADAGTQRDSDDGCTVASAGTPARGPAAAITTLLALAALALRRRRRLAA
jgi:MYXO-CTERM domain-containing protein